MVGRLVIGVFRQVCRTPRFNYYLRRFIYETEWSNLLRDARFLVNDVDTKISEIYRRHFTEYDYDTRMRTLEHRIKSAFPLGFSQFADELAQHFQISLKIDCSGWIKS